MMIRYVMCALVLAACAGGTDEEEEPGKKKPKGTAPTPTVQTSTGDTALDTGTGSETSQSTGSTGSTGDTGPTGVVVDCAALSPAPLASTLVTGARGYHGLVFDDSDRIIGSDGNSLIAADRYGNWSVFVPGTGNLEQLDRDIDGTIYAASSSQGAVYMIQPSGASTVIAEISGGLYGIRVGPDGMVYTANQSEIHRINPLTGEKTVLVTDHSPKVLDFNADGSKLYFGTNNDGGRVYSVDLDATYTPVGAPIEIAQTPNTWHDGLTVDVCGNIYVAEYWSGGMYRIYPTGQVGTLFVPPSNYYGHGVVFGTGSGGWNEMAIYIPQPYNSDTVSEVLLDVPHRTYTGPVINGP